MSSTLCLCLRKRVYLLSAVILLGFAASVRAGSKPLSKAEQAKIDKSIDRAVEFLKKLQKDTGEFGELQYPSRSGLLFNRGSCFFPALALLESGVPATDPTIQKTARMVRAWEQQMDRTYEVSVAILFLDRLGDPKDKEVISSLALRLIAAQTYTGGWGYYCPTVNQQNRKALLKILLALHAKDYPESISQNGKSSNPSKPLNAARTSTTIPVTLSKLAIFQDPRHLCNRKESHILWIAPPPDLDTRFLVVQTDNSNTQFAILALWAANRHGVPVDRTFHLVVKRFMSSQNKDGTWGYYYDSPRKTRPHDRSICNTAGALLGLATAHGLHKSAQDRMEPDIQDRIITGLTALSKEIGKPTGQMDRLVPIQDLYFLWSVERVAALYNLSVIDDKDWYRWGAEILVTNQKEDGTWLGTPFYFNKTVNPSFGLLFLKRANFTRDLTAKLPLTGRELNKSITDRLRSMGKQTSPSSGSPGTTSESNRDR